MSICFSVLVHVRVLAELSFLDHGREGLALAGALEALLRELVQRLVDVLLDPLGLRLVPSERHSGGREVFTDGAVLSEALLDRSALRDPDVAVVVGFLEPWLGSWWWAP